MTERYRANLARVEAETGALAERTASLAAFRKAFRRSLSAPVRGELLETAQRLERTAAGLRGLAANSTDDEVVRLMERARKLGVPL